MRLHNTEIGGAEFAEVEYGCSDTPAFVIDGDETIGPPDSGPKLRLVK